MRITCALPGCEKTFFPRRKNHIYHSPVCAQKAANARRAAGGVPVAAGDGTTLSGPEIVRAAQEMGYVVTRPRPVEKVHIPDTSLLRGDSVKIGIVSDTHLGSVYQQISHLRTFYDFAQEEGVDFFLHGGDVTDGPPKMHLDAVYNLFAHGYQAMRDYVIEAYPTADVPTYMIGGNHDYAFMRGDGGRIVEDLCAAREDLEYLGESGAYFQIGPVLIYLHHPHDGGSYALSYKLQKRIEAVAPEQKPHVWLSGNYHKGCYVQYRNVHGFILPSFQSQTPFMRGKGLESIVGGIILEITYGKDGIRGITQDWRTFYVPVPDDHPGGVAKSLPGGASA